MEAAAVRTIGREPAPAGECSIGQEGVLQAQLELFELKRTDIFNEIDKQLSNLSRATAAPSETQPRIDVERADRALPRIPAPPTIPEIAVPYRRDVASLDSRVGPKFRAALLAGAVVAALGLAWIGGSNLVRLFDSRGELTGPAAIDAVVERIISAESGGATDAKNKRSSAAGAGQFLDDTWLDMIRLYRPDLAKAHSRDETLDLRHEAKLAREMTMRFAERNAALLKRRGLPVTAATLYLAHFAGGAGAAAILLAPADADAARVMANADATGRTTRDQIVKANPFLERFTVADLKLWADRKMRGFVLSELFSASARK